VSLTRIFGFNVFSYKKMKSGETKMKLFQLIFVVDILSTYVKSDDHTRSFSLDTVRLAGRDLGKEHLHFGTGSTVSSAIFRNLRDA
jgi:hypothetical protein